jgi:hypothetical protein
MDSSRRQAARASARNFQPAQNQGLALWLAGLTPALALAQDAPVPDKGDTACMLVVHPARDPR